MKTIVEIVVKNGIVDHVILPKDVEIEIIIHDWGDIDDDTQAVKTSVWPFVGEQQQ